MNGHRRSDIWRFSERLNKTVVVEDQCHERFYNSKSDPNGAEEIFQNYEGLYGQLAGQIWRGEPAGSARNYFGLVAFMVSLHFRNPAYANLTKDERITVYIDLEGEFLFQSLGVKVEAAAPSREHLELFTSTWKIRLMTADQANLLTCDNPSQIFHREGIPCLITMPVTPFCCAVAFDNRCFPAAYSQSLSGNDIDRLNRLQICSCQKALFSHQQLTADEDAKIRILWANRQPPPGFVNDEEWRPNYRGIEPFDFLSLA